MVEVTFSPVNQLTVVGHPRSEQRTVNPAAPPREWTEGSIAVSCMLRHHASICRRFKMNLASGYASISSSPNMLAGMSAIASWSPRNLSKSAAVKVRQQAHAIISSFRNFRHGMQKATSSGEPPDIPEISQPWYTPRYPSMTSA